MAEQQWYISDEKMKPALSQTQRLRGGIQLYECVQVGGHEAFEAAMEARGVTTLRDRSAFEKQAAASCYFDAETSTYYITKHALDKHLGAQLGPESGIERGRRQSALPRMMVTEF